MIGRSYKLGVGKETTRGTLVAPDFWIPLLEPPSFVNKTEYKENTQGIGVIADSDGAMIVKEKSEGEFQGKVRDKSIGIILLATMGEVASGVKETTAYSHQFSVKNDNQHQSLSFNIKNDIEDLGHALGMIQSFKLNAEIGDYIIWNASVLAKKGVSDVRTPAYVSDEHEFVGRNLELKIADDMAGLDAASATSLQSLEISFDKNLEEIYSLGNGDLEDIANKTIAIEGNIEARFDSTTLKAIHEAGTTKALRIDIVNSDVTIGATSHPQLRIDLAKVSFQDWDKAGGNDDIITQTIRFKGHYSLADGKICDILLVNEQSSY